MGANARRRRARLRRRATGRGALGDRPLPALVEIQVELACLCCYASVLTTVMGEDVEGHWQVAAEELFFWTKAHLRPVCLVHDGDD